MVESPSLEVATKMRRCGTWGYSLELNMNGSMILYKEKTFIYFGDW